MTQAEDTALRSALHLLEQEAPEAVRNPAGLTPPTRRDAALRDLKAVLHDLPASVAQSPAKPVLRTLHHLACTGGTLLSKAIAAQPNVALLSEVDPFSPLNYTRDTHFRPTDMIGLAKMGSRAASRDTQVRLFQASIEVLAQDNHAQGIHMVLREHSHGKYTHDAGIGDYPGLRTLLDGFDLLSVVTVRDPIDSYLALQAHGWISITPAGFDEYCRRMLVFLDDHAGLPVIRYEDFVTDPDTQCRALCDALALPYNPDFADLIGALRISGDSGRRGTEMHLRPRRTIPDDLRPEFQDSPHHAAVAQRLGYSTDLTAPE
ncbi:MAG: sulfotransferase [Pseudomonadota bacterium]